ncbi:MAG: protein phosphatase CheZ [Steroidobacteraceae bacterium]
MIMAKHGFAARHRAALAQLNHAYAVGDEGEFELALEELFASRKSVVLSDVQRLSKYLLDALTRFRSESRIATLAVKDITDAQLRLDHVLTMTEEAAHRTLDIIELSAPLADATARGAAALSDTLDERSHKEIRHFLAEVRGNAEQVRRNLTEVMLAQGFQDLTGQILRGVRKLVGEVESVLQELASITGISLERPEESDRPDTSLQGPAIPNLTRNAVTAQDDVDDLIAGLGI